VLKLTRKVNGNEVAESGYPVPGRISGRINVAYRLLCALYERECVCVAQDMAGNPEGGAIVCIWVVRLPLLANQ